MNNETYFVGKDVATALGYKNTKDALAAHVAEEDRRVLQKSEIATIENHIPKDVLPVSLASGDIPNRGLTIINESGLYALIFGSKLESAKRFKHWVTSEVLPSIRKNGGYIEDQENLSDDELLSKALMVAQKKIEERDKAIAERDIKIEQMRPKEIFADAVSASQTSILIGDLAKLLKQNGYETGQKRLFEQFRQEGYLIKSGSSRNMPTQKSMDMGLLEVKETSITNPDGSVRVTKTTKVTGKGQSYFVNRYLSKVV
ncbi:MAG: phage antirepressor KilAC domain-containing protein [Clostridiales bacterium]|nr:phage antirepressor KilAC domain-containing protein [Clostridiales bacterium]